MREGTKNKTANWKKREEMEEEITFKGWTFYDKKLIFFKELIN
jgi:hypothetical protein